jgi:DNA-binding GntR family transcriptional regulator
VCGERLVELSLAHEMNVSQNTVRDALRLLEQDGLVMKHARRGTFVRTYTPDEVREIYALWATLESLALRWALEAPAFAEQTYLAGLIAQFREHPVPEHRFRLHEAVLELADKPRTSELLRTIHNQARLLENLRPTREQAAMLARYEPWLEAITARDQDRALGVLNSLLSAAGEDIVVLLEDNPFER